MIAWVGRHMARWLDRRVGVAKFLRSAMNHVFPDHWSFMLGEIALYCFIILVITGTFLALFFDPSSAKVTYQGSYSALKGVTMSAAYRSALSLSFDICAGLLVRQMHHWAALAFIAAILAHLSRIFFTAAYRRPREINWVVGLTLLVLALANGYFGYSLLGDLLSGAGLRVAYSILMSVPFFGRWLAFVTLGGTVPNPATTSHMYIMHVWVIPVLIAALIAVHLSLVWRQMHTNYPGPRRTNSTIVGSRLWPSYAAKSVGLFFMLFGLVAMLGGLVQIDPVWVYGPYNPIAILPGAQPDWYLGWVEGAMRLFPAVNVHFGAYLIPEVFFPAMLFPFLLFAALYVYPFLEELLTADDGQHNVLELPWDRPLHTAFGCSVFVALLVLLFAGGDDVIAVATHSSVVTIRTMLRVLFFAAPAFTIVCVYLLCRWKRLRTENR